MKDYLSAKWNLILLTKIAIYGRESSLQLFSVVLLSRVLNPKSFSGSTLIIGHRFSFFAKPRIE